MQENTAGASAGSEKTASIDENAQPAPDLPVWGEKGARKPRSCCAYEGPLRNAASPSHDPKRSRIK